MEGFYVSSMGGAAYTFHGLGVNYVAIRGRCDTPSVLLLNHREGEIDVRLEPVNVDALWATGATSDGRRLIGFYALQQALFERYAGEYPPGCVRIFAVGPAAGVTHEGAIGSSPVHRGELSPVVDWAGRGGLGSRLLLQHNLVGCVFGGSWDDPDLRDLGEIDAYFLEHCGQKTIKADPGTRCLVGPLSGRQARGCPGLLAGYAAWAGRGVRARSGGYTDTDGSAPRPE